MKSTNDALLRRVKQAQTSIAQQRDILRNLIEDARSVEESCDEAVEALEQAIDALSRYL